MSPSILDLAESENEDGELVPDILPVDARLSASGPVSAFSSLFVRAASVTPAKEVISGTGHALLEAFTPSAGAAAFVRLTATDGNLTVQMVADGVEVAMAGAALVPAKKISDILKLCPSTKVHFEVLGNTATLRSWRAQWAVQTPVGDTLPPSADVSGITTYSVPTEDLRRALAAARVSASSSNARASLKQLSVRSGRITGMDGGRMHSVEVRNLPADLDLTIPLRAADEVLKMIRYSEDTEARLGGNASHLLFVVGDDTLIAQRDLVPFPDISTQMLAPALTNTHTLTVEREALLDAIARVRVNADPDYQALFLTLSFAKGWTLSVSARDRDKNSARESLEVAWAGPAGNRSLCVSHRNLTDLLNVLDGEHVAFKVGDDTKSDKRPLFVEDTVSGVTGWVNQMRPGYLA